MKREVPILFTSAGRRVGLLNCFRSAARDLGIEAPVHACDLKPELSAACQVADASFEVPRCDAPGYVDALLDHCSRYSIGLLVPTIDPELEPLAHARSRFEAIGTKVHVSGEATIAIVRDKLRTVDVLGAKGVPVPRSGHAEDARAKPDEWQWPLFIKPAAGSASRGIGLVCGPGDIASAYDETMIVQQLLEGDEYTVNIFVDEGGKLSAVVPHQRLSVRAGEVEKGVTVRRADIEDIAQRLVEALPDPQGAMCFQLIDDRRSGPRVFEINARFGGGYPLADHAGARFASHLLSSASGRPGGNDMEWREGVTMLRYDAAVYLD